MRLKRAFIGTAMTAAVALGALSMPAAAQAAPPTSAPSLQGRSALTDGPLSILVLAQPTNDKPGKVRFSFDMNIYKPMSACLTNGGHLSFRLLIGNMDTQQIAYESPDITVLTGAVDVDLPEGNYVAEADPWTCDYESEDQGLSISESGNAWVIPFTLGKCKEQGNDQYATVSFLEGSATVKMPDGSTVPLAADTKVPAGAQVVTSPTSRAQLTTCDGSTFRVGPSSTVTLKQAYFGPAGEKKFSAKLFFGQIWTKISGVLGGGSKWELETVNAANGVRGTTWCTTADKVGGKTRSLIRVVDGVVAVTGKASHKTVLVPAGMYSQVIGSAAPTKPKPMPPAMIPTENTCQ